MKRKKSDKIEGTKAQKSDQAIMPNGSEKDELHSATSKKDDKIFAKPRKPHHQPPRSPVTLARAASAIVSPVRVSFLIFWYIIIIFSFLLIIWICLQPNLIVVVARDAFTKHTCSASYGTAGWGQVINVQPLWGRKEIGFILGKVYGDLSNSLINQIPLGISWHFYSFNRRESLCSDLSVLPFVYTSMKL